MRDIIRNAITFILAIGSMALAQGITLPSEPSQAPIGGLGWWQPWVVHWPIKS